MASYENVKTEIWATEFRELSPTAKLLYLWSFTTPRCNSAGIYRVDPAVITFETGLEGAPLVEARKELDDGRFMFYDDVWLWVRSRLKHYATRGAKTAKGVATTIAGVPSTHPFRRAFLLEYSEAPWLADELRCLIDAPSIPHQQTAVQREKEIPHTRPMHGSLCVEGVLTPNLTSLEEEPPQPKFADHDAEVDFDLLWKKFTEVVDNGSNYNAAKGEYLLIGWSPTKRKAIDAGMDRWLASEEWQRHINGGTQHLIKRLVNWLKEGHWSQNPPQPKGPPSRDWSKHAGEFKNPEAVSA